MNIKTFAVVKCWVMNKKSTPQASSMVPELLWHAGCPRRVGRSVWGGYIQCHRGGLARLVLWAEQEMLQG